MPDRQIFGSSRLPGPLGTRSSPGAVARPPGGAGGPAVQSSPRKAIAERVLAIGKVPEADGEVNTYNVSEFAIFWVPQVTHGAFLLDSPPDRGKWTRAARTGDYRVIFVNGQAGNPQKHMMQACALAAVSGGPVQGIYNVGRALPIDLLKSAWLKMTSSDLMKLESKVVGFFEGRKASEATIRKHLRSRDCPASAALFDLLLQDEYRDARIVGHSQGNIVICNAINGIIACRGEEAVDKMQVIAVASPTVFWEKKRIVTVYSMRNDLVGWLSGDLIGTMPAGVMGWSALGSDDPGDRSEVVTGYKPAYWNLLTHSFYLYLAQLWDMLQPAFPTTARRESGG